MLHSNRIFQLHIILIVIKLFVVSEENSWNYTRYLDAVLSWISATYHHVNKADDYLMALNLLCDQYLCQDGQNLKKNSTAIPSSNGCGSYGYTISSFILPEVTNCCVQHDHCYDECGRKRSHCDKEFRICLDNVCSDFQLILGENSSLASGCYKMANVFEGSVQRLGCLTYMQSQKAHCYCGTNEAVSQEK